MIAIVFCNVFKCRINFIKDSTMSGKGFKKASAVVEDAPQSADFQIDVSINEIFIFLLVDYFY